MTAEPSPIKYSFSGHETFPFRYAWLPKGVRRVQKFPDLFVREDAIVILGVGKNMVRSIRHWCEVLVLIERVDRAGRMRSTRLGRALFGRTGWDPFFEDPGTPWLLHWHLASQKERASTWHLAFTCWTVDAFSREQLLHWLLKVAERIGVSRISPTSVQRDVEVFLRTYVSSPAKRELPLEDTFDCPLVELSLIREVERGYYQFVRGPKPSLPDLVFLYALSDYWQKSAPGQQTLSFETIQHGAGSPGAAFKLSEDALAERLERLPRWTGLVFDDSAGMRQVLRRRSSPARDLLEILDRYYRHPKSSHQ
jgi:hypothetical protein